MAARIEEYNGYILYENFTPCLPHGRSACYRIEVESLQGPCFTLAVTGPLDRIPVAQLRPMLKERALQLVKDRIDAGTAEPGALYEMSIQDI